MAPAPEIANAYSNITTSHFFMASDIHTFLQRLRNFLLYTHRFCRICKDIKVEAIRTFFSHKKTKICINANIFYSNIVFTEIA